MERVDGEAHCDMAQAELALALLWFLFLQDEEQIDNAQHAQPHRDHRDWELQAVRTLQIYAIDSLYRLAKEKACRESVFAEHKHI